MNSDQELGKQGENQRIAQFIENWRGLKRIRNRLVSEFEHNSKNIVQLSESADEIHKHMISGFQAQIKAIKSEVRSIQRELKSHLDQSSIFDRVSLEWVKKKKTLQKEIGDKTKHVTELNSSFEYRSRDFYRYAKTKAESNKIQNQKSLKKLDPLVHQIKNLNLVLEAVDKQDEAVAYCVTQNDVNYAIKVAKIWKRRDAGEPIGDGDLRIYGSALRGEVEPERAEREQKVMLENAAFLGEALRMMMEKQKPSGPVIDATFEEIKPTKILQIEHETDQFSDI